MSNIDELKQNAEAEQRIDINNISKNKSMVSSPSPKISQDNVDDRVVIDLTSVPRKKEEDPDIKESFVKEILEGEDSPFEKYKQEKIEEYTERMAVYEQEQELEESLNDKPDDPEEKVEIGYDSVASSAVTSVPVSNSISTEESYKYDDIEVEPTVVSKDEEIKESKVENPDIDVAIGSTEADIEGIGVEIEDEEDTQIEDQEEILKKLQKLATERLKPVSQKLNISSFTILKKPSANTSLLKEQQVKAAKWVLPSQNSTVQMKEYLGSELEALREYSEDASSLTQLSKRFKSIYDHIISPKPATFEAWTKLTPYSDIDHYFFAVYIASFKGANFLPMDCENNKCKETFLTDDINIMDMVKFDNDKAKEKFIELYQNEEVSPSSGLYCTEIVPLSDKVAVGFKEPSVYSLFEIAALSTKNREKYASILDFIPYIDALYLIDKVNSSLIPVGYKVYTDNATKSTLSKVQMYDKVLKTLTVDEFGPIKAYIKAINDRSEGIGYIYPSVTCPKCKTQTTERRTTAEELVFTRYQLGALVNTSLN